MKKISLLMMVLAITAFTFTACEDVPAPEGYNVTPSGGEQTPAADPTGDGTLESPFNVAAAIAKCKEIGSTESTEKYYVKGIAMSDATPDATFGNATFDIADDVNSTSTFTAFQVLGTDGKKMPTTYTIPAGAEVVLYGPIYNYKGNTPETAGKGAAYIVSVNGQPTEVIGGANGNDIGSIDAPLSIAEAITVIEGLGDNETTNDFYFVKGTISEISTTGTNVAKYKNIIYTISDGSKTLKIYKGRNLDNTDFTEDGQINVGDEVIVYGNLLKFIDNSGNMVPEMAEGNYIVKLTKGEAPQPTEDIGSIDAPKSVAEALAVIDALEEGATTNANYYVKGKVAVISTAAEDIGPNSTSGKKFKNIDYFISDDGTENNLVKVYRGKNLNNTDFTSADQLQVGDEVIVYGKLQKYKDKNNEIVPEMAQGNYLVKTSNPNAENTEPGGNTEPSGGEVSGNTMTIAMQALGLANATALDTQTLSDGTQLIFSAEENQNAPKYYNSGTNARVYAKNSLTIKSASKNITKVVLNCTANYLGNEQLFGEADGKKVTVEKGSTDITFSGFSSQILKIVNDYTEASAGTQLRIVSITITYAE